MVFKEEKMKISKKILSIFLIALFAIVLIGCDGTAETDVTTNPVTTEEPATDAPTEAPTSGDVTTDDGSTTEEPTTNDGSQVGTNPTFVGLFTNQTYYRGSVEYDILDGVKVVDEEDGDITEDIEVYGRYSLTRVGEYQVYVGVEDSDGNYIERLVTITVKDLSGFTIPDELTTDPLEISLWHSNGATIEGALTTYAEDFEALMAGDGFDVTVNIIKSGNNYDELRVNVINAIRGGELPNIVQGYPDHVMEYIDNNAVVPLTPYIYHATHGYNPDVEDESFLDIVLSYRQENSQYTPDGEYYSVPFNKSTEVMIYNKTIMDALIDEGTITEVPNTWQGLFAIADDIERVAVEEGIIDDIVTGLNQSDNDANHKTPEEVQSIKDNFVAIAYDSPSNAFITLTRQWGGQYTGLSGDRQGEILFDNPQTRAMLSYFYDNRDDGQTEGAFTIPGRWGTEYASDSFKTGQTAVTFGSTGGARYNTPTVVNGDYVFEFGVAPMPYNADMPENRTAIQQGTNMSITNTGSDQEKLVSWLFLKYLTSKEVQLNFALETGYSPVRNTIYDMPEYQAFTDGKVVDYDAETGEYTITENTASGEMLMKAYAAQAAALQSDYLFYDQAFVGSSDARNAVESAFDRVILGTEGTKQEIIDNALAAAVSAVEQVLE
jgi:ABC-type glycerol-3-phosphate transport system substrate-binding protein